MAQQLARAALAIGDADQRHRAGLLAQQAQRAGNEDFIVRMGDDDENVGFHRPATTP